MEEYFSEDLSSRQLQVVAHTMKFCGAMPENVIYMKTEIFFNDDFPIDVVIYEPNKKFGYYIMQTCGLSSYYFEKNTGRSELFMVLPKTWNLNFEKNEFHWPKLLLLDIAYGIVSNNAGPMVGQVYLPKDETVYDGSPDIVGGIVVLPEDFESDMLEEQIDNSYTRFFQVVPVSTDDVKRIDEIGPRRFIEFDLHDADGSKFEVKLKTKKLEGIDRLALENEKSLKGKK